MLGHNLVISLVTLPFQTSVIFSIVLHTPEVLLSFNMHDGVVKVLLHGFHVLCLLAVSFHLLLHLLSIRLHNPIIGLLSFHLSDHSFVFLVP